MVQSRERRKKTSFVWPDSYVSAWTEAVQTMSNDIDPTASAGEGEKRRESSKLIYYWRKTEIKCSATACEIYEADVLPTFVLCGFGFNIFNSRYSLCRRIVPLFRPDSSAELIRKKKKTRNCTACSTIVLYWDILWMLQSYFSATVLFLVLYF